MTLPIQSIAAHLQQVMGGQPSLSVFELCNQAGDHLVSMHSWNWTKRPPVALSLVAGSTFIKLPADLTEVLSITGPSTFFQFVTIDLLSHYRAVQSLNDYAYSGALVYSQSVVTGDLVPRLEVWPTIAASSTTALTLYYMAGIPVVAEGALSVQVPRWLHGLFIELVLAMAQATDEHDVGTRQQRLAEIEAGPEFLRCKQRDGRIQTSLGMMRGGAIEREEAGYNLGPIIHTSINALDPT